jgi:hypothetical protein
MLRVPGGKEADVALISSQVASSVFRKPHLGDGITGALGKLTSSGERSPLVARDAEDPASEGCPR